MAEITTKQAIDHLSSLPLDKLDHALYVVLYSQGSITFLNELEQSLMAARCDLRRSRHDRSVMELCSPDGWTQGDHDAQMEKL